MTAVTEGSRKEITGVEGVEIVYLSTVADGYTFASRFGDIKSVLFQQTTYGYKDEGELAGAVGTTTSGSIITFSVSGTVTAGYLQVWGI